MEHSKKTEHPSFGMISWSRFSSTGSRFFMSPMKHHGGVSIEIHRAELERSLHHDHVYQNEALIKVELSAAQFAEFITTPNSSGVPCTLDWLPGEGYVPEPPPTAVADTFAGELQEDMADLARRVDRLREDAGELKAKGAKMTAGDRASMAGNMTRIAQEISSNMPFLFQSMVKAMGKAVAQAKTEIEAHTDQVLRAKGLEKAEATLPALTIAKPPALEGDKVEPCDHDYVEGTRCMECGEAAEEIRRLRKRVEELESDLEDAKAEYCDLNSQFN